MEKDFLWLAYRHQERNISEVLRKSLWYLVESMFTSKLHKWTTAVTVIIKYDKLPCGNVGDSNALDCIGDKAKPLPDDYKPINVK